MRLYEYRCVACKSITAEFRSVEERNAPAQCSECGMVAHRIISVPQKRVDAWGKPRSGDELLNTPEIWT